MKSIKFVQPPHSSFYQRGDLWLCESSMKRAFPGIGKKVVFNYSVSPFAGSTRVVLNNETNNFIIKGVEFKPTSGDFFRVSELVNDAKSFYVKVKSTSKA